MQRSPLLTTLTAIAGSLLLATAAPAAELGDISVRSFIGQPLSADIELVQVAPDEAASLQVKLAQENVYRGANISMNPVLSGLHMTIVRRDGRQYLRVSTTRPVEADYLHLFLELSGGGRQEVRAATVWLQADPNPSRASVAPVAAVGSPAPAPLPPAPLPSTVAPAAAAEPAAARGRAAPLPSLHESEVGVPGGLRASAAAAPARRPSAPGKPAPAKAASSGEATSDAAVPVPVVQALLPMPNLPLPKSVKRAPAPAACAASPAPAAAKECAAFDAHSQELNSKLSELEGKLKVLQGALGAAPAGKGSAAMPGASASSAASASAAASVAASAPAKLASSAAAHASEPAAAAADAASGERWVPPPGVQGELAKARAAAAAHGGASDAAAASASAGSEASASAEASAAASAAASEAVSGPVKKVKVLPKLKYKKEKPPEPPPSSLNVPLIAAGAGVAALVLGLAGWLFWRKKRGAAPLKIGQLFRKKKAAEPEVKHEEAPPLEEVTPESLMQQ